MKTYRCQCCYHNGQMIKCEMTTNLNGRMKYCPYDGAQANWTTNPEEWERERNNDEKD